jgi:hypothetical protein
MFPEHHLTMTVFVNLKKIFKLTHSAFIQECQRTKCKIFPFSGCPGHHSSVTCAFFRSEQIFLLALLCGQMVTEKDGLKEHESGKNITQVPQVLNL